MEQGIPTAGLLFVGGIVAILLGVAALVQAGRNPKEYGGKGPALVGIVAAGFSIVVSPFILGMGAAIAIPLLLRGRVSANEAGAIGDLRTLAAAERTYAAKNGAFVDRVECLEDPRPCLKGASAPFITHIPENRAGYVRSFHPGLPVGAEDIRGLGLSPTSLQACAFVAVPLVRGQTGVRSFCADSAGEFCYLGSGGRPAVVAGACVTKVRSSDRGLGLCAPAGDPSQP